MDTKQGGEDAGVQEEQVRIKGWFAWAGASCIHLYSQTPSLLYLPPQVEPEVDEKLLEELVSMGFPRNR